jgi:hypothetical protein
MRDWSGNRIPMYRVTACASEATRHGRPRGLCPPRCEGYQGPRTDDRRLRRLNVRADQINGALRGRQLTLNGRRQPLEALGWTMRRATRPMMSMCTRSPSKSATRQPCNYDTTGRGSCEWHCPHMHWHLHPEAPVPSERAPTCGWTSKLITVNWNSSSYTKVYST